MDTGDALVAVISVIAAYFIGGIPFGVVVARVIGGPDPRTVGSGRTGGANTLRALGPAAALVAGLLDAAKGAVAVAIPILLGGPILVQALAALAAIVGHSRSPYIGFAGGRGVAPGFGGLLVIQPWIAALIVPVFFGVLAISRYSSLASLSASATGGAALAGLAVVTHLPSAYVAYAVAAPALIWLFHSDNIQRLLSGQERKIQFRR
jgi:acyl phosphate:glycerol-3-phosphate acyltransferase